MFRTLIPKLAGINISRLPRLPGYGESSDVDQRPLFLRTVSDCDQIIEEAESSSYAYTLGT